MHGKSLQGGRMVKLYQSKEWLRDQLLIKGKSPEQVAAEIGVSHMTIRRYAKKFGLI